MLDQRSNADREVDCNLIDTNINILIDGIHECDMTDDRFAEPKVSILIPTFNSAKTIEMTLKSVESQDYQNKEICVYDGGSTDGTLEIISKHAIIPTHFNESLLGTRVDSIQNAKGDYILLLDSDLVLRPETITRAVNKMQKGADFLVMEETPAIIDGWVDRMWWRERVVLNSSKQERIDPTYGDVLPRLFEADLLKKAVRNIPQVLLEWLRHPDHQIIYFECRKLSSRVGFLDNAIMYYERNNPLDILRTYFRHGKDAGRLKRSGFYSELSAGKSRAKVTEVIQAKANMIYILPLLILKSLPFLFGLLSIRSAALITAITNR